MFRGGELAQLLRSALGDARFDLSSAELNQAEDLPNVALLETSATVSAFVALNGNAEAEYERAFDWFENTYSKRLARWGKLDPLLVLVRGHHDSREDAFYNKVETNTLFCRKFVLELAERADFHRQLWRLPFVPLPLFGVSTYRRKVSARALVREMGANADYAYDIAQPGQRSPARLLDDYLSGGYRETARVSGVLSSEEESARTSCGPVRLLKLGMTGFRAYREPREFDLDADIIVLSGQNGLGKTSFFDAVDFIFTGEVGRLRRSGRSGPDSEGYPLRHRESTLGESCVSACTSDTTGTHSMRRTVQYWSSLELDGRTFSRRKEALLVILGLTEMEIEPGIADLACLFRATHFFGQEYVELMPELRSSSRLRPDTITRLLALQDYANAAKKLDEVTKELSSRIENRESRLRDLNENRTGLVNEIQRLKAAATLAQRPDDVTARARAVTRKAAEILGPVLQSPAQVTTDVLKSWRLILSEHTDVAARKRRAVAELSEWLPQRDPLMKLLSELEAKQVVRLSDVKRLEEAAMASRRDLDQAEAENTTLLALQQELASSAGTLTWWLEASGTRSGLQEAAERLRLQELQLRAALDGASTLVNVLQADWNSRDAALSRLREAEAEAAGRLHTLNGLKQVFADWMSLLTSTEKLNADRATALLRLESLKPVLSEIEGQTNGLEAASRQQQVVLDKLKQTSTAMQQLIDAATSHVSGSRCPVCGANYQSKEALLVSMRDVRGAVPSVVRDAEETFLKTQQSLELSRRRLADEVAKVEAAEKELRSYDAQLAELADRERSYVTHTARLGAPPGLQDAKTWANGVTQALLEESKARRLSISEGESALQACGLELAQAREKRDALASDLAGLRSTAEQTAASIRAIENEAVKRSIDPTWTKASTLEELEHSNARAAEVHQRLEVLREQLGSLTAAVGKIATEHDQARQDVDAIAVEIASARAQVTHSEELAKQSGLRVDKNWLGNEALRLDQQVSSLGQLIEETARLEAAMDAAEKTASMVVVERRLLDMDVDIRATEDERRRLEAAKEEFFEKLRRRIDRIQHAAIGEYVQSFGPLASVIQSRLRPVYGFGPMKLTPKGGEVELSVEGSHGSGLRPDLYFSESQLQTAMLSLYLSAALTQEWSPLTAVLMDDPVTHFDDLNSYAFLDLIRGLVTGKCRRQFILSTCEDRLYRLMHRKFAGLNVRFYEFKSIGTDGPVIVQTD